jgi:hypothetical protein
MEPPIVLLIGVPVAEFPDYPSFSQTKTTWYQIKCHHCPAMIWLGQRQLAKVGEGIQVCIRCAAQRYGVTDRTPMTPLTHERKS